MAVDRESVAMRALDLFSGIGGFALAGESVGIETAAFCEIEPFAVNVLQKRFPGVPVFPDVRELGGDSVGGIDIVCGGFPCQDLSVAGKRAGLAGERSGLWYEMLRIIAGVRPHYVLAENVRGAVNLALDTVQAGMEAEGYKVWPYLVPAAAFGAPHQRERLFVVGVREDVADAVSERLQRGERAGAFCEDGTTSSQPASECGEGCLWPTPSVHGNYNRRGLSENSGDGLATAVKMWPTPTSTERSGINPNTGRGAGLTHAVSLWPTPHRNCSNGAGAHGDGGLNIQTAVSLSNGDSPTLAQHVTGEVRPAYEMLSPDWVECLMNFPLGWTDPDCDEPEPWPGWPAMMGESQYPYEPPRTGTGIPHRAARLCALGNAVVPAQAYPFFEAIATMEDVRHDPH